jgi:hypothetical protein
MIVLRAQPRSILIEADSEFIFSGDPKYRRSAFRSELARIISKGIFPDGKGESADAWTRWLWRGGFERWWR